MKRIEPWGLVHKYGLCFASKTKTKLRKEQIIPFINQFNLNSDNESTKKRLISLENFLKEHDINVDLLDDMNNNDIK
jgi:hypothetical protein